MSPRHHQEVTPGGDGRGLQWRNEDRGQVVRQHGAQCVDQKSKTAQNMDQPNPRVQPSVSPRWVPKRTFTLPRLTQQCR